MKENGEVHKWYTILAYAPFSYNIITEITYEDKRLTAEVRQNFRTYSGNLQESMAYFLYKDGNLYEESYLTDCEMAQMTDKRIFKADLPDVERVLNIDEHNYTEVSSEKYTTGSTRIHATICGCDNLEMSFYIETKLPSKKTFLPALYNQTVLNWIHFLSENTRYRTLLNKVHSKFIEAGYPSDEFDLDNTWKCRILQYTYDQSTHRLTFAMNLKNIVNKNQLENWDITVRRK